MVFRYLASTALALRSRLGSSRLPSAHGSGATRELPLSFAKNVASAMSRLYFRGTEVSLGSGRRAEPVKHEGQIESVFLVAQDL